MKRSDEAQVWLWSGLFGFLTSIFFIFGYQLEKTDHIDLSDRNSLMLFVIMFLVITFDTGHVFKGYDYARKNGKKLFGFIPLPKHCENSVEGDFNVDEPKAGVTSSACNVDESKKPVTASACNVDEPKRVTAAFAEGMGVALSKRKSYAADFVINHVSMIIMALPVLIAEFPGFFVYDAQEELNEVLTRSFSTHHPLLHVLLLGGTIALVHKITGSWNIGIFVYLLLQLIVITAVFAYVVTYLQSSRMGKKLRILWLIFYGAFPTIVMYSLCSCKDGLFSALLLLLTVFLVQLVRDKESFLENKKKMILFVATAVLMPLFRHNGFYAYLVFVPFALAYFRKSLKLLLISMLILPVVIYLAISNVLALAFSSEITHHQEMLTVPIMQLARVYSYEPESLSDEDKEIIESYIPKQNLEKYTPRISDLVKVDFNNELYEKDSAAFWGVWKKLLKSHPMAYVNAWLLTCYGYVYPPAAFNVYKGNSVYTFTYDESSYFGYETEPPGERKVLIPAIDRLYRYLSLGPFYKDHPVLYLLFAPGLYLVIYMFVFAYRLSKRRYDRVLPFLPMILCFCTVLLGPTYLIRYVLYLWLCLPLLTIPSFD